MMGKIKIFKHHSYTEVKGHSSQVWRNNSLQDQLSVLQTNSIGDGVISQRYPVTHSTH